MKLRVSIETVDCWPRAGAVIEVPDIFIDAFEPLKVADEALMALATNEELVGSSAVRAKEIKRQEAAKHLSERLAVYLVAQMAKQDTFNGYPIKEKA